MENIDRKKMKQDLFLAQLRSNMTYPFECLREYFDSAQDVFRGEQSRTLNWMERKSVGLSQDDKDRFYEWYGENYRKLEDSFPEILRNSLFIAIYSELEGVLIFSCNTLSCEKKCAVSKYKGHSGKLDEVKTCLENDIGIKWSISPKLWNEIDKIRLIRNSIVHKSGWLDGTKETDQKLVKYICTEKKSVTLLKSDDSYRIQLTDSFILEVLNAFGQLLDGLFTPISDWVRQG